MRPIKPFLFILFAIAFTSPALAAAPDTCKQYADKAIDQLHQAQSLGLPTPAPVWSGNYQLHYNWCLSQSEEALAQGNALRQAQLDKAEKSANPTAVAGAVKKSPTVPMQTPAKVAAAIQGDSENTGKACERYAAESVRQNQENLSLGANLTGPAWSNDYRAHYNWCIQGNNLSSTPQHLADREKALQEDAVKFAKEPFKRYATESVRQDNQSKAMSANFPPPVWSSDFKAHYDWSHQGKNVLTTPGHLATREKLLQEYAIQHNKGSAEKQQNVTLADTNPKGITKKLTPIQQLNRLQKIRKGPDPMVAVFMHTLEKSVAGASNFSQIEEIMLKGIKTLSPIRQQELMDKWQQIPMEVRMAATPGSLQNLTAQSRVEMPAFINALVKTSQSSGSIKMMKPISNTLIAPTPNMAAILNKGQLVAFAPQIKGFSPMGPDGPFLRLGEPFTLSGINFSTDPHQIRIHFLQKKNGKYGPVASVYAQTATATQITSTAIAPGLEPSDKATQIVVEVNEKFSAPYNIVLAAGLSPTPEIVTAEPSAQFPGDMVLVSGKNMGNALSLFMQAMDAKPSPYRPKGINFNVSPTSLNPTQFEFKIPQDAWSGSYKFNVRSGNSGYSNYKIFEVLPSEFKVEFKKITCRDESDPEFGESDEIVTSWVIIADNVVWTKQTGEYTGFDDGEKQNYSSSDGLLIPGPGKDWQPVKDFIYFRTTVYEWDSGDISAWTDGIKAVSAVSKDLSGALGTILGNPVAGKIAGDIIKTVGDGLAKLIDWIGNDPDLLGSESLSWSAPELQVMMSDTPVYSDTQLFLNDDDTGSYALDFSITRDK